MKNTLKKMLCLLMALAMVLSLAACGGDKEEKPAQGSSGKDIKTCQPRQEM